MIRGLSNCTISQREHLNRMVFGRSPHPVRCPRRKFNPRRFRLLSRIRTRSVFHPQSGLAVFWRRCYPVHRRRLCQRSIGSPRQLTARSIRSANLPVPTGSSDTRLVLRDAFGREQEISSQQYYTSGLLKQGLHEFSYNLGARRNNLGDLKLDYGPPGASRASSLRVS